MTIRRIAPDLEHELELTGLPWRLEHRGRHYALIVADRMVGVLSKSPRAARRGDSNAMRAHVRRRAREVHQETAS